MPILDKITREAIVSTVRKATIEAQEMYNEQWVTAEQLSQRMPFFSKEWLKRYGSLLPRECIRVVKDGVVHRTGWCYPLNKLQRMVNEGELREITMS